MFSPEQVIEACLEQIKNVTPMTGMIVEEEASKEEDRQYVDGGKLLHDEEYWERNFFMALIYLEYYGG
jgi:hypothetical protein